GNSPEHPGVPVRQRHLRAGLEPALRRPRTNHCGGEHWHRGTRQLLRGDGRAEGHGSEPHDAAAFARRHGGAYCVQRAMGTRREGEGAGGHSAVRSRRSGEIYGARSVWAGIVTGTPVRAYREEDNVSPNSTSETYVALKMFIDAWRWGDVPFYLRTGKRMKKRSTEIAIQFKKAPHLLFREFLVEGATLEPNLLTMRIQPDEGISLMFHTKVPGSSLRIRPMNMDFTYMPTDLAAAPSAYETLLLDAMQGDATLFARNDEVEAAWRIADQILTAWEELPAPEFPNYQAGTSGPEEADELIEADGHNWRPL